MIDPDRVIRDALNSQVLPAYYWFFSTITWLGSASLWLLILTGCIIINRWRKIASVLFHRHCYSVCWSTKTSSRSYNGSGPGTLSSAATSSSTATRSPAAIPRRLSSSPLSCPRFIAWRYNIITFLLAAAVGMSRIYLGVHFFTDVVAGAAAGIVLGVLAVYCLEKLGLYGGDGLFGIAPRSRGKVAGKGWHDADVLKYAGYYPCGRVPGCYGLLFSFPLCAIARRNRDHVYRPVIAAEDDESTIAIQLIGVRAFLKTTAIDLLPRYRNLYIGCGEVGPERLYTLFF